MAHRSEIYPDFQPSSLISIVQVDSFYLIGGTDLTGDASGKPVRRYLSDAYRYRPEQGWKRIADLPRPSVAAPSPAPVIGKSRFLILGGDDGSLVDFKSPERHPGFPKNIMAYDTTVGTWKFVGEMPAAHVTTNMTLWNGRFVMPTGEVRPGVRSPDVWALAYP